MATIIITIKDEHDSGISVNYAGDTIEHVSKESTLAQCVGLVAENLIDKAIKELGGKLTKVED